jgi:hypothetical protein
MFFLLAGAWTLWSVPVRADVADFENLTLAPNSCENGAGLAGGGFSSGGMTFSNQYSVDPKSGWPSWSGWAYSSKVGTDMTPPDYLHEFNVVTGGGQGGSQQYALAYYNYWLSDPPATPPTITAAQNTLFQSAYLTNTTYAYMSMHDGDGFAKKFGGAGGTDPDWFKLTLTGRNAADAVVGSVDVYLADFRPAADRFDNPVKENYILGPWTKVDLAGLGNTVQSLSLAFASSDNGDNGMNTPAYVALDTLTAVPAGQNPPPPDVQNTAALNLTGGVRELGHISGSGTLAVQPGTTLVADSIVQDTLIIGAGGAVVIRETGAQQASASAVPEPGLLALLLGGGVVIAVRLCRRPRRARIARE